MTADELFDLCQRFTMAELAADEARFQAQMASEAAVRALIVRDGLRKELHAAIDGRKVSA